jgi:hypothetical protein
MILTATTAAILLMAAVPAALLGRLEVLGPIALGGGLSLATIVGGLWFARLAFRGPDRFATTLVVGGFVTRMALLCLLTATIVATTGIELASFLIWLVGFYFVLVVLEAWLLARESVEAGP